jgi:hypothetical protein
MYGRSIDHLRDADLPQHLGTEVTMKSNTDTLRMRVECYAGYRGEERPLRLFLNQRRIEVVEVIDQWYGPDYRYCKVRGDDDNVYLLRQTMANEDWELTMFSGEGAHKGKD